MKYEIVVREREDLGGFEGEGCVWESEDSPRNDYQPTGMHYATNEARAIQLVVGDLLIQAEKFA